MNGRQRITLISGATLLAGLVIAWLAMGAQVFTKSQVPVRQIDTLLGLETIVWKDTFLLGLDLAGPAALVLLAVIGVLFRLFRARSPRIPS
jgi:hypothetical protein